MLQEGDDDPRRRSLRGGKALYGGAGKISSRCERLIAVLVYKKLSRIHIGTRVVLVRTLELWVINRNVCTLLSKPVEEMPNLDRKSVV